MRTPHSTRMTLSWTEFQSPDAPSCFRLPQQSAILPDSSCAAPISELRTLIGAIGMCAAQQYGALRTTSTVTTEVVRGS